MRMKPASTTTSGALASIAFASAASTSAVDAHARRSTTVVPMPLRRACARPAGGGRLLMTCVTAPSIVPALAASISAAMFEPRPEISIVMRASAIGVRANSLDWGRRRVRDDVQRPIALARRRRAPTPKAEFCSDPGSSSDDRVRRAGRTRGDLANVVSHLARFPEEGERLGNVAPRYCEHKAEAAVENAMHLVVGHVALP